MERVYQTYPVTDITSIKQQMLNWANQFNICCLLDNHQYTSPYHSFECLVAAGQSNTFVSKSDFFNELSGFLSKNTDWIFGHFSYDLKNKIEPELTSAQVDEAGFIDSFLFVPEVVVLLNDGTLTIGTINTTPQAVYNDIITTNSFIPDISLSISFSPRFSKIEYTKRAEKLLGHIAKGDCYVINFCQEFYAYAKLNPLSAYNQLVKKSPTPFACYYKLNSRYLLSASPERFIKKTGDKIISQPIKGTSPRDINDPIHDEKLKNKLQLSLKERTENVMVVDLVRNDLSKVCEEGSVTVEELYGIYPFPTVHQMISTVSGTLLPDADFSAILKATFPMGSMTGAPKRRVLELIEQYEVSKRGIYSGTVGYITPTKDFDFNVVIRSLVYNASNHYLSYHTGSALTSQTNVEAEYQECLLKGQAIIEALTH